MAKEKRNTIFQSTVSMTLIIGTGLVMLSSEISIIRKVSEYSVHIMLAMLGLSLVALFFSKSNIMFSGLACTAALCLFLKDASNDTMKLSAVNKEADLNIAHINLSNIGYGYEEETLQLLLASNLDIISFQELTPDWNQALDASLSEHFPYSKSEVRIDPYGMVIYSKLPFETAKTFYSEEKPNLSVTIQKEDQRFQILSSYLIPALDKKSIQHATNQLKEIATKINNSEHPVIALGDYNMVYWTNEIRAYRTETNLTNSRRDLSQGNLRVPYDHIFFSEDLECTKFYELKSSDLSTYIGIIGSYQIKKEKEKRI